MVKVIESDNGDYFTLLITDSSDVLIEERMSRDQLAALKINVDDCLWQPETVA